jgi:hypothetical protein
VSPAEYPDSVVLKGTFHNPHSGPG